MRLSTLTKPVLLKHVNNVFVETGSGQGGAIRLALECGFQKVYSIEIAEWKVDLVKKRFEKEISENKVEILCGDSFILLPEVLTKISESATFWLDAHWDDGPAGKYLCPLMYELDHILNHNIKFHNILIDDRRCFGGGNWGHGIKESEVKDKLKQINPDYKISYENGYIANDIIVASIQQT